MKLSAWGWSPFFQQRFEQLGDPSLVPARVVRVDRGAARLVTEAGQRRATGTVRRSSGEDGSDGPSIWAVGDWCAVTPGHEADPVRVEAILPRRSHFLRKAAGRAVGAQLVAANIDLVFVVTDLAADFNTRRLERLMTLTWDGGARPVVVLNKADLCDQLDRRRLQAEAVAAGTSVLVTSALDMQGLDELHATIGAGATVAFIGSSGVGKSALINGLLGRQRLRTGSVRSRDGRGTHTTSSGQLIRLPTGGILVDTPGMREVAMWAGEAALGATFSEIDELAVDCRFGDCTHQSEPGCAVRLAVEQGAVPAARLASFHKLHRELHRELLSEARRRDEHLRRQHERKTYAHYRRCARLKRGMS